MSGSGLTLGSVRRGGRFHPGLIPSIAAGFYWDPARRSGLGTAGFVIPERQGKAARNLAQSSTSLQPTVGFANGHTYLRFASGTGPIQTAAAAIGTTGPLYVAAWLRFPGTQATSNICIHSSAAGAPNRGFNTYVVTGSQRFTTSADGTATAENRWAQQDAGFHFHAFVFDGADADATHRQRLIVDNVELTPTATASAGATINDPVTELRWIIAAGGDTVDVGMMYLGFGIPSAADLAALRNFKRMA